MLPFNPNGPRTAHADERLGRRCKTSVTLGIHRFREIVLPPDAVCNCQFAADPELVLGVDEKSAFDFLQQVWLWLAKRSKWETSPKRNEARSNPPSTEPVSLRVAGSTRALPVCFLLKDSSPVRFASLGKRRLWAKRKSTPNFME